MRVVRIIGRLNTGGPAIHTILLTQRLNGGRFSSRLVTGMVSCSEGNMEYYAAQRGVRPLVIPELGRDVAFRNDLKAVFRLYRIIRQAQPHLIHTHTTKAGVLGRLAGLLYNLTARIAGGHSAKLVHTFHGHVFHGYVSPFKSRLLVWVERVLALFTHRIVTVSESVKRELVDRYRICPAEKVAVVPLGLDFGWVDALAEQAGTVRAAFAIPRETVTVGIIGRLAPIKNHAVLLSAMCRLRSHRIRLLILGDGELRADLEQAARDLNLEDSVIFVGWQREPEKIYADLDIVCLTSRNEGTPVALIEAMAAGKPFVATRVGGVPDLMVGPGTIDSQGLELFSNGVLVVPDRPDLLATAIEYLAARPDVRRIMGVSGRSFVRGRFSVERLVSQIEREYLDLLAPEAS